MDTSGHDWPGCGMEHAAGALVKVLDIGGFEAEVGPDRYCGALSRARNRICLENHRQIRHRAPRRVARGRRQAISGVNMMFMADGHQVCGYVLLAGAQGSLVGHLDRVVEDEDAVACVPSLPPRPPLAGAGFR